MSLGIGVLGVGVLGVGAGEPGGEGSLELFGFEYGLPITSEYGLFGFDLDAEVSSEEFVNGEYGLFDIAADGQLGSVSSFSLFGFEANGEASQELIVGGNYELFGFETDAQTSSDGDVSSSYSMFGFEVDGALGIQSDYALFGFEADAIASQDQIIDAEFALFGFALESSVELVGGDGSFSLFGFETSALSGAIGDVGLFDFDVSASFSNQVELTSAFVMNVRTNQVSRYQNYDFLKIITIDGIDFGVKSNGLYRLTGTTDYNPVLPVQVNATIVTKDFDFGSYQRKSVPFVYLDSDSKIKITPYADGVQGTHHFSNYNGRKSHLSRGLKGRYFTFKIEEIDNLNGAEFLPEFSQRRVKN